MAEVLVTADDITVLGGPSSITVDLDFGPQGQRGSQIFTGSGQPNNPNNDSVFIGLIFLILSFR
jgi:hypothetical protein